MEQALLIHRRRSLVLLCALAAAALPVRRAQADEAETAALGKQVYEKNCAFCHGAEGKGTKKSKRRLEGDRSISQLAEVIGETMPEDDPGSLSEKEATAVAAYIHDAFYSKVARERNRPARVELARLTVRQYRQAIADVVGGFRGTATNVEERGLNAEYSKGRRQGAAATVKRIDPQVDFDFGKEGPVPEITDPLEFTIRWNGSVIAPESGEFEFAVRTEHAARLWVNDANIPLIDAAVRSGSENEHWKSIHLIGGRRYTLRLEFRKAQKIADANSKAPPPPPAPASIALLWKRPHRPAETVPFRQLAPQGAPEGYVCTTAFPPDDRSYGWERGTFVSKAWDQAATDAALETTAYVVSRLNELAGTSDGAADRTRKVREFCRKFAERAFRHPLDDEQAQTLIDRQFDDGTPPEVCAKRCLLLVLKSPRFLYREIGGGANPYDVAARLSFGLWDTVPDQDLWNAAAAGELSTREQVAKHADRMFADPRTKNKLREFLLTWAKADATNELAKDAARFPGFDAAVVSDLRTSLELFLDDAVWTKGSDYRRLFTADYLYLNDRLAKLYGVELPAGADFTRVTLDDDRRAGVLTHPYLMSNFAYASESSPVHRGVFLMRGVLGQALRPPPEAVTPFTADLHPNLTTRERVALQTDAANCMTCHGIINPLGFTLEHFDAIGRYRDKDQGQPVDATGTYVTRAGKSVTVNGARELSAFLIGSEEAYTAFTEQLFHHLIQQPVRAYGPTALADLTGSFASNEFDIRRLVVEIMVASCLGGRQDTVAATSATTVGDGSDTDDPDDAEDSEDPE